MRSAAGRAFFDDWRIELNPRLWQRVGASFPASTVAHEVAHLVDFHLTGGRGHGAGWRQVMTLLGEPPARTHSWDTDGLRARRRIWRYACACGSHHELGATRHRQILRGAVYVCRTCKVALREVSPADPVPAWQ